MIILSCTCKQAVNSTKRTKHDPALPSKLLSRFERQLPATNVDKSGARSTTFERRIQVSPADDGGKY
ncbi:hypothetical protein FIBSPDRAFT_322925 [Athelia psychrophila]|uniref:Uncharacterized protein n=1 Tax=Athelia psychrophila TaxID=1759441 RepID=A0A167WRV0_9AGAM|nr:hypothetical protein FIBSPDRAFT_322925 [Fibularhizoctonia sp. CBS 109695]